MVSLVMRTAHKPLSRQIIIIIHNISGHSQDFSAPGAVGESRQPVQAWEPGGLCPALGSALAPMGPCTREPVPSPVKWVKPSGSVKGSNKRIQVKGLVNWKGHIRQVIDHPLAMCAHAHGHTHTHTGT